MLGLGPIIYFCILSVFKMIASLCVGLHIIKSAKMLPSSKFNHTRIHTRPQTERQIHRQTHNHSRPTLGCANRVWKRLEQTRWSLSAAAAAIWCLHLDLVWNLINRHSQQIDAKLATGRQTGKQTDTPASNSTSNRLHPSAPFREKTFCSTS